MTVTLLAPLPVLRGLVAQALADRDEQGHDTTGLAAALAATPDSYDALLAFAQRLRDLPIRADWPYEEPLDLEGMRAAWGEVPDAVHYESTQVAERIRTAFGARIAGCILGKPFEFDPTLAELRQVLEPAGQWPLTDYVTQEVNTRLRAPQPQWPDLVRERITHVCEDDDLNYTVLAMLLLERHGEAFTGDDLRRLWLLQLPLAATFGPERVQLLAAGAASLAGPLPTEGWGELLNPCDEHCGALIRADAYGYAFPGDPGRAAWLAARDAWQTHRRTASS